MQRIVAIAVTLALVGGCRAGEIAIKSPVSGSTFAPGDAFEIVVKAPGFNEVYLEATVEKEPLAGDILYMPPFSMVVTLPLDTPEGTLVVSANGFKGQAWRRAADVRLSIQVAAELVEMYTVPKQLTLVSTAPQVVDVYGKYADGVTRRLLVGNVFSSTGDDVVALSEDEVTAIANGQARITVRHGQIMTSLLVTVELRFSR